VEKTKSLPQIHPTAEVHATAMIGRGTSVWNWAQIRPAADIGESCVIAKSVYVDSGVKIGNACKVQNNASIFSGTTIEDGVFIGPHVCFTNDMNPRAVNPDGSAKSASDWTITKTTVKMGASIGANSTIVCGVTIGSWSMVGAGSVVSRDVPPHALVVGNPARVRGAVCRCGAIQKGINANPIKCRECELQIPGVVP
jgi:UDP-2-acetamido-3-amino-2,3-dideoxy-glucuronate N-acetyltransferase